MGWLRLLLLLLMGLAVLDVARGLSAREKLKLHKEWLERRRALKLKPQQQQQPSMEGNLGDKSSYFRRIIKFKSDVEPQQTNDISFMPDQSAEGHSSDENHKNYKYDLITSAEEEEEQVNGTSATPTSSSTLQPTTIVTKHFQQSVSDREIQLEQSTSTESVSTTTLLPPTTTTTESDELMTTTTFSTTELPTRPPIKKIRRPSSLWNDRNRRPLTLINRDRTTTTTTVQPPPLKISTAKATKKSQRRAVWSTWSEWSDCSRSCGGGVRSQERTCRSRLDNSTSSDCIGFYKRYRICSDQACPETTGFREQQCSHYNNHTFKSKQYTWEPFLKADAECELNCKPIRLNYFATLNKTVIDGTPCTKPPEFYRRSYEGRAVCVEGTCKAVHSSGVIVGAYMNNGAVRCGGLVCRPVSGIFSQTNLSNGYHHMATIPTGASNISITELKNSLNFLVLKTESEKYVLNGEFSITPSGIYEAAGTVFDYKRIDSPTQKKVEGVTEWITAIGPTTEPLHLMVLIQHHQNPGVKYEYLLPINTSQNQGSDEEDSTSTEVEGRNLKAASTPPENNSNPPTAKNRRQRKFSWKVVKFAACSKTCGGGIQSPIIKCVREGSTKMSPPKKCVNLNKPVVNESQLKCNTQPCPAYWKTSEWTECNCGAEDESSIQTRDIRCVQELTQDRIIQVHDGACLADSPDVDQPCDCPAPVSSPVEERTPSPSRPFSIIRHPSRNQNGTTSHRRHKKAGTWLTAEWMERCSTECGTGVQHRSIFCYRSPPNTERCDQRFTPDTSRQCSRESKCMVGEWFTGPWSACAGDCFNLTKTRFVYCIRDEMIVKDRECSEEKPSDIGLCDLSEVDECQPKWHTSEWTECTKECNEGTQRRVVKCLEPNTKEKQMVESSSCLYTERPIAFRTCNGHKCHEQASTSTTTEVYDPKVDLIQNDVLAECEDEFPNCHLVVKARLCHHSYYKAHCCRTCSPI